MKKKPIIIVSILVVICCLCTFCVLAGVFIFSQFADVTDYQFKDIQPEAVFYDDNHFYKTPQEIETYFCRPHYFGSETGIISCKLLEIVPNKLYYVTAELDGSDSVTNSYKVTFRIEQKSEGWTVTGKDVLTKCLPGHGRTSWSRNNYCD